MVSVIVLLEAHWNNGMVHLVDQRHLVSCVVTIVRHHFSLDRTILLSSTGDDDDLANTLLQTMHGLELSPLNVLQESRVTVLPPHTNTEKIRSYIMLTRSAEDLIHRVEELSDGQSWYSQGRLLVVVTVEVATPEQLALSIVQVLWDTAKVLNLVVLVQKGTVLNLYTWFPYLSHEHCDDVKGVVIINQWIMEEEGGFVREVMLFPHKIPSNFQGCSLKISTGFRNQAEDVFMSEQLRSLNITLNYVSEIPRNMSVYEKIETSLMDVITGKSDVSFGGLPLLQEAATYADPSFPYFVVRYSWFVPCRRPLSRLQSISHIFSVSVWVAMVIVLFLVTVAAWWVAKRVNDARSYTSLSRSLYNTWAVMVGVSVTEMPRSFRLKSALLGFIWYCFAISTIFQTFFTSFLVDPGYQNQLTTLGEILQSGIEFGYRSDFDKLYSESSDSRHMELLARREECSSEQTCIDRIRETGNFATLCQTWMVQDYTNFINDHSFICPLNDDDTFFVFLCIYMPKGSFLLEFVNRLVSFSTESGIIEKKDRERKYKNKDIPEPENIFGDYFVFTLSHLRIAFYILFVGYGLSLLLLLGELLHHFRLRKF